MCVCVCVLARSSVDMYMLYNPTVSPLDRIHDYYYWMFWTREKYILQLFVQGEAV